MTSRLTKLRMAGVATCCSLLMTGCVVFPPYLAKPNEKTASVKLMGSVEAVFCKNSEFFSLPLEQNSDYVRVPANERITLETRLLYSGYNITYSCYPSLSFVPEEGGAYALHTYVREKKCFVELVREDNTTLTGIGIESSVDARNCFKKK